MVEADYSAVEKELPFSTGKVQFPVGQFGFIATVSPLGL